jgi:hypothetical protein
MKRLFLIFLISHLVACQQPYNPDTKDVKDFFANLADKNFTTSDFILVDAILTTSSAKVFERAAERDTLLAKDDIAFIVHQMSNAPSGKWTKATFERAKIVPQAYLDTITPPGNTMRWPEHYKFSRPYFSKDKTYCVLEYYNYCGNLCQENAYQLYRLSNGKWYLVKAYARTVS